MKRTFVVLALAGLLASCGTFYPEPKAGEPGTSITELGERRGATWYETFAISEIDGLPVSHMGTDLGSATVRIAPGRHKIRVTATYLHGMKFALNPNTTCPCRADFPIDLEIPSSGRFAIAGSFDEAGVAKVTFVDATTKQPLFEPLTRQATPVRKNTSVMSAGGTWIHIPSPK